MRLRHLFFMLGVFGLCCSVHTVIAAEQVLIKGPKNTIREFSGQTYGPITSKDTLWQIASRHRQNNQLSMYQVMLAIYQLNPQAFDDSNINNMIDGSILRLPTAEYAAQIDVRSAERKTLQDNERWQGQSSGEGRQGQSAAKSNELAETKQVLENKLSAIDEQQTRQFQALRDQFAQSINGVQSLIDENNKIYQRLDAVNAEIDQLRSRIGEEGEVQQQMDKLLTLQNELVNISRQEQQKQKMLEEAEKASVFSSPIWLILGSTIPVLLLLGGLAYWLKRRQHDAQAPATPEQQETFITPPADPEPQLEQDDLSDALSDELSGEMTDDDLFGDDLLDDSLDDELLGDLAQDDELTEDELDNFEDLTDDLLDEALDDLDELDDDPIVDVDIQEPAKADAESDYDTDLGEEILQKGDLDDLFDSEDDEPQDSSIEGEDELLDQVDEDAIELSEAEPEPDSAELQLLGEPDEEDPEDSEDISISKLLDEEDLMDIEVADLSTVAPIDDERIDGLDEIIKSRSEEIDDLTEELVSEIDSVEQMKAMLAPDDIAEDDKASSEGFNSLEDDLDDAQQVQDETPEAEEETVSEQDQLADELLAELSESIDTESDESQSEAQQAQDEMTEAEEETLSEQDQFADELLAELSESIDTESDESQSEAQQAQDEMTEAEEETLSEQDQFADELLAELSESIDTESDESQTEAQQAQDKTPEAEEETLSEQDQLADELLAELSESIDTESDESQTELEQPQGQTPDAEEDSAESEQEQLPEQTDDSAIDVEDELEKELAEQDDTIEDDELEQALEDFEQAELAEQQAEETEQLQVDTEGEDDLDAALADFEDDIAPTEQDEKLLDDTPDLNQWLGADNDKDSEPQELPESEQDETLVAEHDDADSAITDDIPGLGDWLDDDSTDDEIIGDDDLPEGFEEVQIAALNEDDELLEELENSSFDDMLEGMDNDDDLISPESKDDKPTLDNPDLDLEALFSEAPDDESDTDDYVEVDELLSDDEPTEEKDINIDLTSMGLPDVDDIDLVDVDSDKGAGSRMDLAIAYIEIDDKESARQLLEKIIQSDDPEQVKEAQKLLDDLS